MFAIEFTPEAVGDLRSFKKREQRRILDGIEGQLNLQPIQESRNRKRLRPNDLAEWELRIDKYRVFYDVAVESRIVKIEAIGHKKANRLYIREREYKL